ncbi:MAG: hypothetical protein BZ138_03555 [Methanosphaera sp. rholeuAM270]|nr:MAG: hypothetical protein BZ138_03555 [Methanosphaera sp. rholeuAM270]
MYIIEIIKRKNQQRYKIENIDYADTFYKRLVGLIGKKKINGLIFKQKHHNPLSGSIHTCFMKIPIDIIYINNNMKIQESTTLAPWKLHIPQKGNIKYIIELPEKSIEKNNIEIGDTIQINKTKK